MLRLERALADLKQRGSDSMNDISRPLVNTRG
jgi:hypothetical protein